MSAHRPDITPLHKGGFLQSSGQVKVIVLRIAVRLSAKQVSQFLFIKACEQGIEVHALQSLDLNTQKLLIPSGIHRHAVVGDDICFLLRLCQMVGKDTRHFRDSFLLRRKNTTVAGDNAKVTVDNDGIDEAELP